MDFITGLPKSKGFEAIFVVVDRLSKYAHFILLKRPYSARSLAETFTKEVVRLHGIPESIVSDRDPIFVSNFWQELFKQQGTFLKFSTAYHPQTDGQTEVVNRCLETFLRCFIVDQPKTWAMWLPWAEYWYNTTFHASTGTTPFEVVYGRSPPVITNYLPGEVKVEAVQRDLADRDECLRQLKHHLSRASDRMKTQADRHRKERSFEVGDLVFLKLRPHVQQSVAARICPKLSPRYFGPFKVIERVGAVAYRLELPPTSRIHPVFHVSLLKKAVGDAVVNSTLPASLEASEDSIWEPETALEQRTVIRHDISISQVLIHWKNKPIEEATWEDKDFIIGQFPSFSLEDKAVSLGGGNDSAQTKEKGKPVIWRVYQRRNKKLK
ncbi:unnamed protein product [Trifolium pratense]|uniref:Uncharacterized protein n=1 Tax=Trifolium pratense TaxID=57577 RepID=A0ACB0JBM5_TRIPR|nr:unnamed protein product [Trifolium pratense]